MDQDFFLPFGLDAFVGFLVWAAEAGFPNRFST
jgi:hypothetical protein